MTHRPPAAGRSLDELVSGTGLDPGAGLQVVDAARLPGAPFDPGLALVILGTDAPPAEPIPGRHARHDALASLRALYPATHPLRDLATGVHVALEAMDAERLAWSDWLVPPLDPLENLGSPYGLPWISNRLRRPDGCPWDLRQDHASLRRFVLEEAYELVDAIERGTPGDLAEELGDVLLQVVLHAQLAAEAGEFDLTDVYRLIGTKIVRRHPHVFGDVQVSGADQVVRNWEAIKSGERSEAEPGDGDRAFERLTRALPALPASRELQERAAALGWDWPSVDGVLEKVDEELAELRSAADPTARRHEMGDVLFAMANLARWLDVDPEEALRLANRRWIHRFRSVERLAADRGADLTELDAEAKDRLWQEAKLAAFSDLA